MNKDEWYIDRILWRANKHRIFDRRCFKFSELDHKREVIIKTVVPEIRKPILVFWDNEKKWTILCALKIYSFYDGQLVSSDLDAIEKSISVFANGISAEEIKKNACFLRLNNPDKLIWVPPGSELFALMNILRMFPLKAK